MMAKAWPLESENRGLHPDSTIYSWGNHGTSETHVAFPNFKRDLYKQIFFSQCILYCKLLNINKCTKLFVE